MSNKIDTRKICTITSVVTFIGGEFGSVEQDIEVTLTELRQSGNPRGFVNRRIAEGLVACIADHELPREAWTANFTSWAQRHFSFPEKVQF